MSGNTQPIVTRFAPSPTGALHVGGARTALFSWAYARKHGGKFILRFEDTDLARSSEASAQTILADLQWLGIDWDEGPDIGGPNAPYRQSERIETYNQYIDQLLATGQAYEDDGAVRFRVDDDITIDDAVFGRVEVKAADIEDFIIRKGEAGGKFPTFHFAVVIDDALMGVTHVIRGQEHLSNTPKHAALYDALGFERPTWAHTPSIMNPDGSKMSKRDKAKVARKAAKDALLGGMTEDELLSYLSKYHEVVDKGGELAFHEPGADLFPISARDRLNAEIVTAFINNKNDNTAAARLLAIYLHAPLPEIDVSDFRKAGYLPDVLCNYISLLGWNPGGDVERFDKAFFIDHFSLERIGKANSKFDRDKLCRFNADSLKAMTPDAFRQTLYEFSDTIRWKFQGPDDPYFAKFADAYHERTRTLKEPEQLGVFFFRSAQTIAYDPKAVEKVLKKNDGEGYAVLEAITPILEALELWDAAEIDKAVHAFAEAREIGMGKVAQPLRVAVTGSTVSPSIGDTLMLLGRPETMARIARCLTHR